MNDLLKHLFVLVAFIVLLIITIFLLSKFPRKTSGYPSLTIADYWWERFSIWSKEEDQDDVDFEVVIDEKTRHKILKEKPKEEKEEKPSKKKEEHYRSFSYCDISIINSVCCDQAPADKVDQIA